MSSPNFKLHLAFRYTQAILKFGIFRYLKISICLEYSVETMAMMIISENYSVCKAPKKSLEISGARELFALLH